MREHRISRVVIMLLAPIMLAVSVLTAIPARALDASICDQPGRYLLLTDPTGVANDALCREQEKVLKGLSEDQWGQTYTEQQRARILRWAQDQALGAMYLDLLRISSLPPAQRTTDEAAVYLWFQQAIAGLRSRLANAAYAEQIEYANNPCDYTPPGPNASKWAECDSSSMVVLFGGPPGPTYEDFVNFGAERLLGEELPGIQSVRAAAAERAARTQALAVYAGVAGGAALSGGVLALLASGAGGSLATAVLTGAATSATAAAAGAGAISTLVATSAISVTAVIICIVIAVIRGVEVFTEKEIPGKLRDDIANASTLVDVATWLKASDGNNVIALTAMTGRINTAPPPSAPAPSAPTTSSPNFLVTGGGENVQFTQSLDYRSPLVPDATLTTWLDSGWWVIKDAEGNVAMTHTLQFTDHEGDNRTAVATANGFFLFKTSAGATDECDAATKCEHTDALPIMAPGEGGIASLQRSATLADTAIIFTQLPTVDSSYEVGDTLDVQAFAHASYPATMSYQWKLVRHASESDITDSENASRMYRTLTMPGDYTLSVTAIADSGETGSHSWDFEVTGSATGQLVQNILVTQYPDDSTDGTPPLFFGPWLEGDTHGTLCVTTGSSDPTDFTVKFFGDDAMVARGVTDGYACFPRPASASQAGVHSLETVSACLVSASFCLPPYTVDVAKGITTSAFSYEVTNLPGTISDPSVGLEGGTQEANGVSHVVYFAAGDTVELHATVSDSGGAAQSVVLTWSDGWTQTFPGVASGAEIVAKHTFARSSLGPVGAHLIATDAVGQVSNISSAWFVVRPQPAGLSLTATADAAGRASLVGGLTDPEGSTQYVVVEWGDGTHDVLSAPFASRTGAAAFADADAAFDLDHLYADGADHTVTVTAYNGAATNTAQTTTVTIPASAPALSSADPISVATDGTVQLTATVGDLTPGEVLTLYVDYGDGSTADFGPLATGDAVALSHGYAPGRQFITLVAADASGLNSPVVIRCVVVGATAASTPCPEAIPATDADLAQLPAGAVSGPGEAHPGDTVTMTAGTVAEGDTVFGYLYSTPLAIGTYVADATGSGTLAIPTTTALGTHQIALFAGGELVGYAPIEIVAAVGGDQGGGDQGGGDQGGNHAADDNPVDGDQLSGTGANIASQLALFMALMSLGTVLVLFGRRRSKYVP